MTADLAWAAGLFEGEGTIDLQRSRPRLRLNSTDEDVVRRFAEVAGFGSVNGPYQNGPLGQKPIWYWTGQGQPARAFALSLLPLLGIRRSARVQEVFA